MNQQQQETENPTPNKFFLRPSALDKHTSNLFKGECQNYTFKKFCLSLPAFDKQWCLSGCHCLYWPLSWNPCSDNYVVFSNSVYYLLQLLMKSINFYIHNCEKFHIEFAIMCQSSNLGPSIACWLSRSVSELAWMTDIMANSMWNLSKL